MILAIIAILINFVSTLIEKIIFGEEIVFLGFKLDYNSNLTIAIILLVGLIYFSLSLYNRLKEELKLKNEKQKQTKTSSKQIITETSTEKILTIKNVLKLFGWIIIAFIAIHQLVQPLFFSRLASFESMPLYIVSEIESPFNVTYYRIFKNIYMIEPKLIYPDSVSVKLPSNTQFFTPQSGFTEKNPYIEFIEPEEGVGSFIDSNEYKEIIFKLKINGIHLKKLPLTLYFRDKVVLECSNPTFSNEKWYSESTSPEKIPKIECYTGNLAYGQIKESGVVFRFDELILSNRGDLDVRGFISKVSISDTPQTRACEDNRELPTMDPLMDGRQSFISLDLKAGETRRIIVMNQAPGYFGKDILKITFPSYIETFYFNSSYCGGDWSKYIV